MYTSKNTSLNIKLKSKSKVKMCRMFNLQNIFWQNKWQVWVRTVSKIFFSLLMYFIKEHADLLREVQKKNLNSKIFITKNGRLIMQSKCADCGIKKSRFVKEQEAKGLLSSLGLKTRLGEIFFDCIK